MIFNFSKSVLTIFILISLFVSAAFPAVSFGADDDQEKELFFVAQSAFDDGFYDVAIRYIEEFLQKYPQSDKRIQVQLLSGQCYFFKNQYLKAFNIFQELLKFTEFKDATFFWLGETYLKGLDYVQAQKHYQQVIDQFPQSVYVPQAYYSLGWAFFDQKKYKEAVEIFQKLVDKFPDHQLTEDAFFKIAESVYNQGEFSQSIDLFQKYLAGYSKSPRVIQVNFNIAEAFYYQENYAQANVYYQKVVELAQDPGLAVASLISQGWGYLKLKNYNQSLAAFNRAEQMAQEQGILNDEIYLGKASFFSETGDGQQALDVYAKLIELFPESDRLYHAYLGRANIFYSMQQYSKAIEEYRKVIEQGKSLPDIQDIVEKAHFGLAWTYLKMGDVDQSIANFQNILDTAQSSAVKVSALTQIGDAYQDLDQWDKAVELYDKILKDYPGNIYSDYVQYRMGIALLKLEKIESATLTFQSLAQNFPASKYLGDIDYYLGVAYFKKNDWSSAIKYIDKFLQNPNRPEDFSPEASYVLALSYLNLRKTAEALQVFQKIIKLYSGNLPVVRNSEMGIAKAHHQLGQDKEAIKKFKMIIYKYPGTETEADALLWLGRYYSKASDFVQAIDYYEQIIKQFPGSEQLGMVRFELGQVYEYKGDYNKALKQYRSISSGDKEMTVKAGLAIAGIFSKEMEPEKAAQTYQEIIDNNPDFRRDAYVKLAQVYRKNSQFEKEIETYRKALESLKGSSSIGDVQLQFSIGEAFEMMNDLNKSTDAYLKVPYLYKDEPAWGVKAYLRAAKIFENQEDWESARTTYVKILSYNVEESKYAQERIDWIDKIFSGKK